MVHGMIKTETPFLQRAHMFYEHVLFEYHKLAYSFPTKSLYTNDGISQRFKMAKPLSLAERFTHAYWEVTC